MRIEEAEFILNETIISEPSVKGYIYISAEEINEAINKMLEDRIREKKKIQELENTIISQRNRYEDIIKEKDIELEKNLSKKNSNIYFEKEFKYIKKVVNPLFLLEN